MSSRFPHGGEVLGASPAHPLLAPVLRPEMVLSRQQALLDLQAIQRIPGLAGYWPADPAYLYQDSAGYIPASVGGVVGQVRDISNAATPVARRNLLTYTEQFDNAAWIKSGTASILPDTTDGPLPGSLADTLSGATDLVYLSNNCSQYKSVTSGNTYTFTVFVKSSGSTTARLNIRDNGTGASVATALIGIDATWVRLTVSYTVPTGTTSIYCTIGYMNGPAYIWGAQLELGAEATPYQKIVTGTGDVFAPGNHAYQQTTSKKPVLKCTPTSNVYWLNSDADDALTVTLGNLGSACTVATAGPDGPTFKENVSITSTYNIAKFYEFNADIAIFNRALTASEKALISRYMLRQNTLYGSLVNAAPQMRGTIANTETATPNWGGVTSLTLAWYGCSSLTAFPLIDTHAVTNFNSAWHSCSSLTSFPLIDTSAGTGFYAAWYGCSSLTAFPLIDTHAGTNFGSTWQGCSSLTAFPLIDTHAGTNFNYAWQGCSSLTAFPLIDTHAGTNFSSAWRGCSSLTSFPLIDTHAGTDFSYAWFGCSSLTSFPLLDTSAGTSFYTAWSGCSSLTSFPSSFFDAWTATPVADCFSGAWTNCTALTQTSLNNIVASLVVANKAAPAIGKNIHLDGNPTLATMQGDAPFMGHITTLKGLNWIPRYKGTAL